MQRERHSGSLEDVSLHATVSRTELLSSSGGSVPSASSLPSLVPPLPVLGAPQNPPTPKFIFVAGFFIVVATILGTGILGLPVKLTRTGFGPFVLSYSITFVMQVFTLIYTVELMQRVHLIHLCQAASGELERAGLPDMHSLGRVLLPHAGLRVVFDAAVMLHFVSILLSYGIGGSEAYAQALGVPYTYVIPFFVIFWSLFILIGYEFIHKVISVFTFAKGSLLAVIVLITAIVAYYAQQPSHSDWVYVGQPLLVGTVALGGGMNLLPVVYGKLTAFSRRDMVWLCWSCVLAITGVYVLNVMWCYYILKVVPQTGEPVSLELAAEEGEIATLPLIRIIRQKYPQFTWIAVAVNAFIMISLTASFMTVGTGMKHTLDGFAQAYIRWASRKSEDHSPRSDSALRSFFLFLRNQGLTRIRILLYIIFFGMVFVIAVTKPKSLITTIERVTSLALNIESGFCVALMLHVGRMHPPGPIPYPLPDYLYRCRWVVMLFFIFACVYNGVGGLGKLLAS